MKQKQFLKSIFLALCLLAAGMQSVWAYDYTFKGNFNCTKQDDPKYAVHYYTYKYHSTQTGHVASIYDIMGTGDVVIPQKSFSWSFSDLGAPFMPEAKTAAVGWLYGTSRPEDVNCTSSMNSLTFEGGIEIHGNFTLQNLYGSLNFCGMTGSYNSSKICSDASLEIPRATSLYLGNMNIEAGSWILAPSLTSLSINGIASVSGFIHADRAASLSVAGTITAEGEIETPSATQVTIASGATVYGTIEALIATTVNMESQNFYGTLKSNSLTGITLGNTNFGTAGKLDCPNLRHIYIPNSASLPVFNGGYSSHFTAPRNSITVHVYDMTAAQIAAMKTSSAWNGFKEIVNHKSTVSYTLVNDGNARMTFIQMNNPSYPAATTLSQLATIYSGSKTGTATAEKDYAVEIMDVDFDTKNVQLLRNGHVVTLQTGDNQGRPVRYYEDLNLMQDVRYELTVTDKTCTLTFNQTGYQGRIMYEKTLNGTTTTGVVTSAASAVTCARGSQLKLTIPYDQYTPNLLRLNGSTVTMTKANGEATATITVPSAATADVDLTWQEPQQTYETHQPQIMIMRSGEGQVMFKGAVCLPSDEWSQYLDDYEQSGLLLSGRDGYGTWVMTGNGPVSCTQTVTNVTAPCVDPRGDDSLDEGCWGFIVEITPVAGQKLKTLLLGSISGDGELMWEDMLFGDFSEWNYVTYNASTNTYTFDIRGDYMNFGVGDYVVNIAMGPEETAVETGATLNFVRKGGQTEVLFGMEDPQKTLYDQSIEEGTISFKLDYFTQAEQDDSGMSCIQWLTFNPVEGEVIHVFCDATDISDKIAYQNNGSAYLNLERRNHTYTILIEESPDANPTWTMVHNGEQIVLETELTDGTTQETTLSGNVDKKTFTETNIAKATLKVPLTKQEPTQGYQLYFANIITTTNKLKMVKYVKDSLGLGYDLKTAKTLVDAVPCILNEGKEYTDLSVAQKKADGLIALGAEVEIRTVVTGSTSVPNGQTIKLLRNGVDVTSQLDYSDADFATMEIQGNALIDEVWQLISEDAAKILNAYANNDVRVAIAKVVEGGQPQYVTRENSMHQWVNEGETYIVKFTPMHGEELTGFNIGWNPIDIANESRLVKNEGDGTWTFTASYDEMRELSGQDFSILAVFSAPEEAGSTEKLLSAYVGNGTSSIQVIMPNGELNNQGGGLSHNLRWLNSGEGVKLYVIPNVAGTTLKKLLINGNEIDIANDTRLTTEYGDYVLTLTADYFAELPSNINNVQVFAEFEAADVFDLNEDGVIDMKDVRTVKSKYLNQD